MDVGLVTTLLNEEKSLPEFLDSVLAQTRPPREVILVDGGSRDRSCEIIRQYITRGAPMELLVLQGANRSRGRNAGIRHCRQPIIAMTDVGCRLAKEWLEKIVAPLERGEADVASGYFAPEAQTLIERAIAAATVPLAREVNPWSFLPSSRSVAFLREAWEKVGGYPEWSSWNEDTLFALALKKAGMKFSFVPEAVVCWRQQGSLRGLFRQFYRYAYGDAAARIFFRHYGKAFLLAGWLLCLILSALLLAGDVSVIFRLPVLFLLLTALGYAARYVLRSRRRGWDWPAALFSPLAMAVVDVAHYFGWLLGMLKGRRGAHNRS